MRESSATLRLEMRDQTVAVAAQMADLATTLRKELSDQRAELLKWAFAFWLGQIVALAMIVRALQG